VTPPLRKIPAHFDPGQQHGIKTVAGYSHFKYASGFFGIHEIPLSEPLPNPFPTPSQPLPEPIPNPFRTPSQPLPPSFVCQKGGVAPGRRTAGSENPTAKMSKIMSAEFSNLM